MIRTESQFLKLWNTIATKMTELEVTLLPAKDAICEFHRLRKDIVLWDTPELSSGVGIMRIILGGKFVPEGHEPRELHWHIPIANVLEGKDAVTTWLKADDDRRRAKAQQLGQERELREKDDRRKLFQKLKLEFEPPESAIVKYKEA